MFEPLYQPFFVMGIFKMGSPKLFAWDWLWTESLLSSYDYRHEPQAPSWSSSYLNCSNGLKAPRISPSLQNKCTSLWPPAGCSPPGQPPLLPTNSPLCSPPILEFKCPFLPLPWSKDGLWLCSLLCNALVVCSVQLLACLWTAELLQEVTVFIYTPTTVCRLHK
jgi:hypothetical protein